MPGRLYSQSKPSAALMPKPWRRRFQSYVLSVAAAGISLTSVVSAHAKSSSEPVQFALVIGVNESQNKLQKDLKYADDDAARMHELLTEVGARSRLLATLDKESQQLFPTLRGQARPATVAEIRQAFAAIQVEIENEKRKGNATSFVIYYSGHGDVGTDGQAFLTLGDGKLTRDLLFDQVLAQSPADLNHLIVDACQSSQMIFGRGSDWKPDAGSEAYVDQVSDYLKAGRNQKWPKVGVMLASSADNQTHEWEKIRGGVFTHEVLSGLRGAADINGDGEIEYSEIGAFVAAANQKVKLPRARLSVLATPPAQDRRAPLVVHDAVSTQRVLYFDREDARHYELEDRRGVAIAELYRSAGSPSYLRLPHGEVFVRRRGPADAKGELQEARIDSTHDGLIAVNDLSFAPGKSQSRGAMENALQAGLFETPFGVDYYAGYSAQPEVVPVERTEWRVEIWGPTQPQVVVQSTGDASVSKKSGDGARVTVRVDGAADNAIEDSDSDDEDEFDDDDFEDIRRRHRHKHHHQWLGLSAGIQLHTPVRRSGIDPTSSVVGPSDLNSGFGKGDDRGKPTIRGIDLRWTGFKANRFLDYPGSEWFFRSGFALSRGDFTAPVAPIPGARIWTKMDALTIPFILGGNLFVFERWPVRPFVGAGAGLTWQRLSFTDTLGDERIDRSMRVTFQLQAGIEARITNFVVLFGEAKQSWSNRRKLSGVPDYRDQGASFVVGLRANLPTRW